MTDLKDLNEMIRFRHERLDELIERGEDPHKITSFKNRNFIKDIRDNYSDYEEKSVRIAGRIMSKRGHGKINFMNLIDSTGNIQLFNKFNNFSEEEYGEIKKLDIGDIVGVEGEVFTTESGEISVRSKKITLLTKSLQILPEKFHGLKDQDLRYRQRYTDLIMNPEIKDVFVKRSKIISKVREF